MQVEHRDIGGVMNVKQTKLLNAKLALYNLLLHKDIDELTESEVDLGYQLAFDKDVQKVIQKSIGRSNGKER